jgi:hypothetical protein
MTRGRGLPAALVVRSSTTAVRRRLIFRTTTAATTAATTTAATAATMPTISGCFSFVASVVSEPSFVAPIAAHFRGHTPPQSMPSSWELCAPSEHDDTPPGRNTHRPRRRSLV